MSQQRLWLLGGVVVLVLAGTVAWTVWELARLDAKFIPLASALVSGTATLIGVAVGAMVLRFNYRAQANPLRLEFFKRQLDATNKLIHSAHAIHDEAHNLTVRLSLLEGKKPDQRKQAVRKQVKNAAQLLLDTTICARDLTLALQRDIHESVRRFVEATGTALEWVMDRPDPVEERAMLAPLLDQVDSAFRLLLVSCVLSTGGDLTSEIAELLGVDLGKASKEFTELVEEEDRARRLVESADSDN
jgi:hypothetical protein